MNSLSPDVILPNKQEKPMKKFFAVVMLMMAASFAAAQTTKFTTTPVLANNGVATVFPIDTQDGVAIAFGSVNVTANSNIYLPNDPINPGSDLNLGGTLVSYTRLNEVSGTECGHTADSSFTAYYVLNLGEDTDANGNVYSVKVTLLVPFTFYNCGASAGRGGPMFPRYKSGQGNGVVTFTKQ